VLIIVTQEFHQILQNMAKRVDFLENTVGILGCRFEARNIVAQNSRELNGQTEESRDTGRNAEGIHMGVNGLGRRMILLDTSKVDGGCGLHIILADRMLRQQL
jgi:hypothetical protein